MVQGLMGVVKQNMSLGQILADGWKVYRSI